MNNDKLPRHPSGRVLERRPGSETHRTYYLEVFGLGGAIKVHTTHPDYPKQLHPDLVRIAAMVERAPELAEALARMCNALRLKAPALSGDLRADLEAAELLLQGLAQ